jgi:hypothetical protein
LFFVSPFLAAAAAIDLDHRPTANILPIAMILPLSKGRSPESMIPTAGSIETMVAPFDSESR